MFHVNWRREYLRVYKRWRISLNENDLQPLQSPQWRYVNSKLPFYWNLICSFPQVQLQSVWRKGCTGSTRRSSEISASIGTVPVLLQPIYESFAVVQVRTEVVRTSQGEDGGDAADEHVLDRGKCRPFLLTLLVLGGIQLIDKIGQNKKWILGLYYA